MAYRYTALKLSKYGVISRIRTEYGPEKIPYLDTFHAVVTVTQTYIFATRKTKITQQLFVMANHPNIKKK